MVKIDQKSWKNVEKSVKVDLNNNVKKSLKIIENLVKKWLKWVKSLENLSKIMKKDWKKTLIL